MSDGVLRLISAADRVADFDCGVHALNDFLKRHALPNSQAENSPSRTWILPRVPEDPVEFPEVLGFVTLSMTNARSDQLTEAMGVRLPRYPMPVALIGRLAVDRRAQGRKLGRVLLRAAFEHVLVAAQHVGCVGVLVHAKDEAALRFYQRADFVALEESGWPRPAFAALSAIKQNLAHEG